MWEFLSFLVEEAGIVGLASAVEAVAIVFMAKAYLKKDRELAESNRKLLEMSNKRLQDVVEEREKYQTLSQDMNKSMELLVEVFRRNSGLGSRGRD